MNIKEQLLKEHNKLNTIRIANYIGNDKKLFKELMETFLIGEYRVTQRAVWVVSHSSIAYPNLIKPYMRKLIDKLKEPGIHNAVKRNIVKIWETLDIPEEVSGEVYDICFGYIRSLEEPIAVKAFSITIVGKIAKQYPELQQEIKATIEDMIPFGSAAIIVRGKKLLKEFQKA